MPIVWKAKPDPPPNPESERQMAGYFKALAHPARIRILRLLLAREESPCGQIVAALPLAQSTVSQHLRVLKGAGLVSERADGPRRLVAVNRAALQELRQVLATLQAD